MLLGGIRDSTPETHPLIEQYVLLAPTETDCVCPEEPTIITNRRKYASNNTPQNARINTSWVNGMETRIAGRVKLARSEQEQTLKYLRNIRFRGKKVRSSSQLTAGFIGLKKSIKVLLWACLLMVQAPSYAQQNLPDMGEPADTALSPQQERLLGAEFMRRIRASVPLIRDTQVNEYLQNLGTRLASSARSRYSNRFTFFILADSAINAFAFLNPSGPG